MKNILLDIFLKVYGDTTDVEVYFAPGRVNLIGEHTDYNGGHVCPCALSIGTYAAVRLREDQRIHLYSENIPEVGVTEVECGKWDPVETADWCNYPIGVMWALEKNGIKITKGMDIVFYGNIPSGSGLSSSASIEVLTAYMLREELGFDMSLIDIALLCQYSENHFNGMRCGIMDQFASAMGKKDHAI